MIGARDSSFARPGPLQVLAAAQAGVRVWGGYLATRPGVGLAAPWLPADFAQVQGPGWGPPLAFCSGWDDPAACGAAAAALGLRLVLDVEDAIRDDGPWVDAWLEISGAGLYGLLEVHYHPAPFRILADYPGYDPQATWLGPAPAEPHGWQWEGTHTEFGLSVDSLRLDDWFLESVMTDDQINAAIAAAVAAQRDDSAGAQIRLAFLVLGMGDPSQADYDWWLGRARIVGIEQMLADMLDGFLTPGPNGPTEAGFPADAGRQRQLVTDYADGKLGATPVDQIIKAIGARLASG